MSKRKKWLIRTEKGTRFAIIASSLLEAASSVVDVSDIRVSAKSTNVRERFLSKVEILGPDECWNWQAGRFKKGYGRFGYKGKSVGAHRVSWELHKGPIHDDLWVLHKCDNPPCVNPRHLFLGTAADNNADSFAKGRSNRTGRPKQ